MNNTDTHTTTQYLVKTPDGTDYARVEQWQGGLTAASNEALRLGGYVVELDEHLCPVRDLPPVLDYRPAWWRMSHGTGLVHHLNPATGAAWCNRGYLAPAEGPLWWHMQHGEVPASAKHCPRCDARRHGERARCSSRDEARNIRCSDTDGHTGSHSWRNLLWPNTADDRDAAVARVVDRGSTPDAAAEAEGDFGPGAPFADVSDKQGPERHYLSGLRTTAERFAAETDTDIDDAWPALEIDGQGDEDGDRPEFPGKHGPECCCQECDTQAMVVDPVEVARDQHRCLPALDPPDTFDGGDVVAAVRCPVDVSTHPRRHVIVVKHTAGGWQTFSTHEVTHDHVKWASGQGHYDLTWREALADMVRRAK